MANLNMDRRKKKKEKNALSTYLWINEVFGYATTYVIEFPYALLFNVELFH